MFTNYNIIQFLTKQFFIVGRHVGNYKHSTLYEVGTEKSKNQDRK